MHDASVKILLFGKNGQVGWELQRSLSVLGEVTALDYDSAELCGDFTNLDELAETVHSVQPQIIVNAAAYTAVDRAESEPELARTINAVAPSVLASEARRLGAWLVHYSTDYVFNGNGSVPWRETDTPYPLNVYGQTKLEGEQAIQASGCRYLIFRTSWVYAARGDNFIRTILRLASERDQLSVIDDQIGAPTGADLLADITAHAIRHILGEQSNQALAGIYHLTSSGETSWYGYACFVLEMAVKAGMVLKAGPDEVIPIPSTAYSTAARRPLNSRLNTHKLQKTFGLVLPDWWQGVARMLAEII